MFTDPQGLQTLVRPPIVRPSTREMVRHPELIQRNPTLRENPGVHDDFMEYVKGGSDFLKGYRQDAMDQYLREQGIEPQNRRLPPPPPGCVLICPDSPSPNACRPGDECKVWCGPRIGPY